MLNFFFVQNVVRDISIQQRSLVIRIQPVVPEPREI